MTDPDDTAPGEPSAPSRADAAIPREVASRLAFIRYLHHLGVEQSLLPEPRSSTAVLALHDAVEAFLLLAAEYRGVAAPSQFANYWDALAKPAGSGVELTVKQGMVRLNKVRVALKHHGVLPGREAIAQIVGDTATFFAANTPLVFGVAYDQVSMADVITQGSARTLVRLAESAAADDDYLSAMMSLADAVESLLSPRRPVEERSPLLFGETIHHTPRTAKIRKALTPSADGRGGVDRYSGERSELAEHITALTEIVTRLQAATRITSLGINYAAYLRFRSLTPAVDDMFEGRREYYAPKGYAPTNADFEFCLQFVITLALRLAEADSHLAPPTWLTDQDPHQRGWDLLATGTWLDKDQPQESP
ncbi:hypothetical protein [Actinoplanes sp. NPDC049802]|uniref:hypothetical protein n=1 Tax=Actinoplanes sp. NPDC049802 TaxID=3154742 RepID=UPI0033DA3387